MYDRYGSSSNYRESRPRAGHRDRKATKAWRGPESANLVHVCLPRTSKITLTLFRSALTDLQVPNNAREYSPSGADVGRKIVFRYTPVNSEGLPGEPVSVTTPSPVELAPPELADVAITGSLMEGGKVAIASRYVGGGTEGNTRIQWLKSKYPKLYGSLGDSAIIELGGVTTEKELPIPVDAIGWFLGAKVTPAREDGVLGAPVYVAAADPVVCEWCLRLCNPGRSTFSGVIRLFGIS